MGRWSRLLARAFVEWLQPAPAANWLEVGCGTGALTSTICDLCEPASVVACDPSEPFIEHARKNLPDARASFVVAGAKPSAPRRRIRCGGLRARPQLPADPGRPLTSMRERLRSGGTVAAYVWDYAEGMEFLRLLLGRGGRAGPWRSCPPRRRRFPLCREPALAALFRSAGLAQVETHALDIPTEFATFDDYWTPFLRGTGPAPSYVASLGSAGPRGAERAARTTPPAERDGRIRLRARSWAVRGVPS